MQTYATGMVLMTDAQLYPAEARDPFVLTAEQGGRLLRGAAWTRFAVLGDGGSEGVAQGVKGYRSRAWPDRLVDQLRGARPDFAYLNLAKRGLLTAQIRATQLEPALRFKPDLAAVLAGRYDALREPFDIDAVEIELARIISALRAAYCTVVTIGLFCVAQGTELPPDARASLGERISLVAERTRVVSAQLGAAYVDLSAHPACNEAVHGTQFLQLNARGHAILASEAVRTLARQLAPTPGPDSSGTQPGPQHLRTTEG